MKFKFSGDLEGLETGIGILAPILNFEVANDGLLVNVSGNSSTIVAACENGQGYIFFGEKVQFFRALGLFIEAFKKNESFRINEEPQFSMNGVMIDVSRNAVMKMESVKDVLGMMALMGLNMMMLYAEDTYAVKERPYFGYMRGRYSYEELKACDDFADIFGIEIIPCIQTLAHLTQALKWNYAGEIRDTSDILLAGSEKTYEFVEDMIRAASAPFRSKRIHIGMDEAHNLGLGRYLDMNGYRRRFDIMNEHLRRVINITNKYGLEPMIWSDMYFRLGSKDGGYYDLNANIPQDVIDAIPGEARLVYWDYYNEDENFYSSFIRKHKDFGSDPVFAGGIWTWAGVSTNYAKSFRTTNAALAACKKEGIKEVFATMWGDNGAETNFYSALLGLQLYAEHGYCIELDMDKLKNRFEFCTGGKLDDFMDLTFIDDIPGSCGQDLTAPSNPAKYLLWQDVLIGLFDRHFKGLNLSEYYSELADKLEKHLENSGKWDFVFEMPYRLCRVLAEKSEIGINIKEAYDMKDMDKLKKIAAEKLPEIYFRVNELRNSHRKQWFMTYKPFGWEIIDIRYGGLLARIDTAAVRLDEYITGKTDKLDELDEERLYFNGPERPEGLTFGRFNQYHRIISASPISG